MTKNQDPYALPAGAQQRVKAQQSRRERRAPRRSPEEFAFWGGRFPVWFFGGAVVAGLLAFSVSWPSGMPFALYVGLIGLGLWLVLAWLVRWVQARASASR